METRPTAETAAAIPRWRDELSPSQIHRGLTFRRKAWRGQDLKAKSGDAKKSNHVGSFHQVRTVMPSANESR